VAAALMEVAASEAGRIVVHVAEVLAAASMAVGVQAVVTSVEPSDQAVMVGGLVAAAQADRAAMAIELAEVTAVAPTVVVVVTIQLAAVLVAAALRAAAVRIRQAGQGATVVEATVVAVRAAVARVVAAEKEAGLRAGEAKAPEGTEWTVAAQQAAAATLVASLGGFLVAWLVERVAVVAWREAEVRNHREVLEAVAAEAMTVAA